ncbi:MAG: helix-hairpin-helix domain-containing protein [Brevibacterium sp.]|uniref:Competence protein ComEA n=2 Tax=Brevibacterium linens TaxID=1703 RepID=A0A2H1HKJ4_BRELN|nr:ComEA family DNA-binding protein [Brevibacterium linens]KAB1949517.1 ComEA family DNA-binding protein [Brevibacterium linens ATCC 9172]SMX63036.1 competence protein ComEA [Brevibacterium linens ATCC 9172]SMX63429.1 competence protein ComEA [Brevibacterium linens]
MAVSPDDRFAGLLGASAERGGWVPGDIYTADTAGDEAPVEPRRVRLPVVVALGIATVGILVLAFFLFRPAPQHSPVGSGGDPGDGAEAGQSPAVTEDGAESGTTASATSGEANGKVIVHITGAVNDPSVVTLKAGARVQDAVEAAGGLSPGADGEAVNLARVLADGEQIHIPTEGEAPAAGVDGAGADGVGAGGGSGSPGTADSSAAANSGAPGTGKVDLNTADATTLETLPGVGPVTAQAIISHRSQQPFASVEDLLLVKGIGPKTFESLKDLVTVG